MIEFTTSPPLHSKWVDKCFVFNLLGVLLHAWCSLPSTISRDPRIGSLRTPRAKCNYGFLQAIFLKLSWWGLWRSRWFCFCQCKGRGLRLSMCGLSLKGVFFRSIPCSPLLSPPFSLWFSPQFRCQIIFWCRTIPHLTSASTFICMADPTLHAAGISHERCGFLIMIKSGAAHVCWGNANAIRQSGATRSLY